MQSQEDALLGRIAVHYKLISQEQLTSAAQRQASDPKPLSALLQELKFISADQAKWLAQAQAQYLAKQGGGAPAPIQAKMEAAEPEAQAETASPESAPVPAAEPGDEDHARAGSSEASPSEVVGRDSTFN